MGRKGRDLAARFKSAMEDDASQRKGEQHARDARLEEGRRARDELFKDIEAFATAVGFVTAKRVTGGLRLSAGTKTLMLEEMGDGERVKLVFENSEKAQHRLFRMVDLDRWVWSFLRYGREERMLFWDDGLEELCVIALGLARPGENQAELAASPREPVDEDPESPTTDKPKRNL